MFYLLAPFIWAATFMFIGAVICLLVLKFGLRARVYRKQ